MVSGPARLLAPGNDGGRDADARRAALARPGGAADSINI